MPWRLWDFAVALHGDPAVATALHQMQDESGADVCLVLYLLWRAQTGTTLDVAAVASVDQAIAPWREGVVRPLRATRRALPKEPPTMLRANIAADELEAERLQLSVMEALAPGHAGGSPGIAAAASLAAYAALRGTAFPEDAVSIVLAAFSSAIA